MYMLVPNSIHEDNRLAIYHNQMGVASISVQQVSKDVLEPLRAVKLKSKTTRQRNRTETWSTVAVLEWYSLSSPGLKQFSVTSL